MNIMNGKNTFVAVRIVICEIRPAAVRLCKDQDKALANWLPRSTIHPDDNRDLDGAMAGEHRTIRVRKWKADALGLTSAKNGMAAIADLFGDTKS